MIKGYDWIRTRKSDTGHRCRCALRVRRDYTLFFWVRDKQPVSQQCMPTLVTLSNSWINPYVTKLCFPLLDIAPWKFGSLCRDTETYLIKMDEWWVRGSGWRGIEKPCLYVMRDQKQTKEMTFGVSAACRVSDGMDRHLCKYQDPVTFARQADLLELRQ